MNDEQVPAGFFILGLTVPQKQRWSTDIYQPHDVNTQHEWSTIVSTTVQVNSIHVWGFARILRVDVGHNTFEGPSVSIRIGGIVLKPGQTIKVTYITIPRNNP